MRNETTTLLDNQSLPNEITSDYSENNLKSKLKKSLSLLKPTLLNIAITFIGFIILLAISKSLLLTLAISLGVYLFLSFVIQPLSSKGKFGKKLAKFSWKKEDNKIIIISSNSSSVVMFTHGKTLTSLSLLRIEWLANIIMLNPVWYFLQEEGIQIQDCREGCFLIIRKTASIKKANTLQEEAKKLIKEMEKTILLTKKKFDLEFDNLTLHLVKGQSNILQILNLGLASEKFTTNNELTDDEVEFLKNGSLESHAQNSEDLEQISN